MNQTNNKKKRVLIFMLYSGSPEVDTLLPVIYKLSNKFLIFIIFSFAKLILHHNKPKTIIAIAFFISLNPTP